MTWLRWRLSTLLILIAIVALALGADRARRRFQFCEQVARSHEIQGQNYLGVLQMRRNWFVTQRSRLARARGRLELYEKNAKRYHDKFYEKMASAEADIVSDLEQTLKDNSGVVTTAETMSLYHRRMVERFRRAARRPWEGVPIETPPPDPAMRAQFHLQRLEYRDAIVAFEDAIRLEPENGEHYNNLAWILATSPDASVRDGRRAVEEATEACTLSGWASPAHVDTLAAAYAESGNYPLAVQTQQQAVGLLSNTGPAIPGIRERLALYRIHRPYRETPH